jgi:hypothetical protein
VEWTFADFAITAAGGVVVPIYPTNSPEECAWVAGNSESRFILCEDASQVAKIVAVRSRLPKLEEIVAIEPAEGALALDALRERGRARNPQEVAERVVEHAGEVADAVGNPDQVNRDLQRDLLVGPDLVEVEVENLGGPERVALELADQRLDRRPVVDRDVHDSGPGADADEQLVERRGLHGERLGSAVVTVDHAGYLARAPEAAGGTLPGLAPGGGVEVRLLSHGSELPLNAFGDTFNRTAS